MDSALDKEDFLCRARAYLADKILATGREHSYEEALRYFVVAVANNQRASPNLIEGYQNLLIIEAAEESAKSGRIVA